MEPPSDKDLQMYNYAIKQLVDNPVQGHSGMYHVKNGIIHYGYDYVPIKNFSKSAHSWEIFH